MSGYRHCAHDNCFAIIVGKPGDLCDDCLSLDSGHDAKSCDLCDYDGNPMLKDKLEPDQS